MNDSEIALEILPQPDDTTCGPTCLAAIYRYWGDPLPLPQVIEEVERLDDGGTLAVLLACHALRRGYRATIYTYNLQVFDPTWFQSAPGYMAERLEEQIAVKDDARVRRASRAYLEYLRLGGRMRFEDLTPALIRKYVRRRVPVLTGLSATYLYRTPREYGEEMHWDDVRGVPTGHFVVLCGYDPANRAVLVADPLADNPLSETHRYAVDVDRLVGAILLGILTYDANLLVLEPPPRNGKTP